jgi:ABC-type dipeptide/oligopeptide/nickel transport system ATPase component
MPISTAPGGKWPTISPPSLAGHLIVMRRGKVVEEGPAAELFKNPKSEYTRALFAAAFRIEGRARGLAKRSLERDGSELNRYASSWLCSRAAKHVAGGTANSVIDRYREHVAANAKRLSH